jgi:hypothetical protein
LIKNEKESLVAAHLPQTVAVGQKWYPGMQTTQPSHCLGPKRREDSLHPDLHPGSRAVTTISLWNITTYALVTRRTSVLKRSNEFT